LPSFELFLDRFNTLLERRRRRIREEQREYRIGDLLRDLLRPFAVSLTTDGLSRLHAAYYAPIRRQVSVYADAASTLAGLRAQGYKIGLLSNTCFRARDHREELVHFGLWQHLDAAVFTSTGRFRKPHPEPFRLIARRLRVPIRRCLYVGDRQFEDVIGAARIGMSAVLVRRPRRTYEPGLTQSVEIEQLRDLPSWLGG
jgi:HAD superfamily hydrolase (TIGR01662 family)